MQADIMILFNHKIELRRGKRLILATMSDVHHNVASCHKSLFRDYVKELASRKKSGDTLGVLTAGDLTDPWSTTERARMQDNHETTLELLDHTIIQVMDDFYNDILPISNNIWNMVEGHHFHKFDSPRTKGPGGIPLIGSTSTQYLAMKIAGKRYMDRYLGTCGLGTFEINGHKRQAFIHHGKGGAKTLQAAVNKRRSLLQSFPNVTFIMVGHDHTLGVATDFGVVQEGNKIEERATFIVCTGSYLKSYMEGDYEGTYSEKAMMSVRPLGSPFFEIYENNGSLVIKDHIFM